MYQSTNNVKRISDIYDDEEVNLKDLDSIMVSLTDVESYFLDDPDDVYNKKGPGQDEEDII